MKKVIVVLLVAVLLVASFVACGGGSSSSLVGRWEGSGHEWEFFSDGTIAVVRNAREYTIGNWTTEGDRLVLSDLGSLSGYWANGVWNFTVSRDTFALELSDGYLEFTRVQ